MGFSRKRQDESAPIFF